MSFEILIDLVDHKMNTPCDNQPAKCSTCSWKQGQNTHTQPKLEGTYSISACNIHICTQIWAHCIMLCYITLHYIAKLCYVVLHCITLWCYIALHCITYIVSHCVTLHYIHRVMLYYIVLHCVNVQGYRSMYITISTFLGMGGISRLSFCVRAKTRVSSRWESSR